MTLLLLLFSLLCLPTLSESQVMCFRYQGGMVSCDGPNGQSSTQVPFTDHSGVITTDKSLEPYTILPPAESRQSRSLDRLIAPLDPLPSLDFKSRRDDPFDDPITPLLLLGE